jgi:hypothetical protein
MTPAQEDKLVNELREKHRFKRCVNGEGCGCAGRSVERVIREAITSTRKQTLEWISVKDRLPDSEADGEFVYVKWAEEWRGKNLPMDECAEAPDVASPCGFDVCFTPYLLDIAKDCFTHWQPLPPSPAATDSINADELSAARKEE